MAQENFIFALILGIIFGIFFLFAELYHERYCFECKGPKAMEKYVSVVAGISITYFFLRLLPEIFIEISHYGQEFLGFLFIFIGFCFIHITEKVILKRVERQSRIAIEELMIRKMQINSEEKLTERKLSIEVHKEDWDKLTLEGLAQTLSKIDSEQMELKAKEKELKLNLQEHLNKDFDLFHVGFNYFYHLIIGLLLFNLLLQDYISSILFFVFAFLKATVSNTSNKHVKILDINLHTKLSKNRIIKILSLTSVLSGVILGSIIQLFFSVPLVIVLHGFAFTSGIILYIIIREVIPKEEKGRPDYFLLGIAIFVAILIMVELLIAFVF